jgi:hypothetical protein
MSSLCYTVSIGTRIKFDRTFGGLLIIIIINGAAAQSRELASLTGFVTVGYITMWVISPTINLILVILIQPPETSSGEATIDI